MSCLSFCVLVLRFANIKTVLFLPTVSEPGVRVERDCVNEGAGGLRFIIAKAQQEPVFAPWLPGLWQLVWTLEGLQVMVRFFWKPGAWTAPVLVQGYCL